MIIEIILSIICALLALRTLYEVIALEDPEKRAVVLITSILFALIAYYFIN